MGDEIANVEPVPLTMDTYKRLLKKPLLALPDDLRLPVLRCWTLYRRLMPSVMEMSVAVSIWVQRDGLDPRTAAAILDSFTSPDRVGEFQYPHDVMRALGQAVALAIRNQREMDELRRRQDEAAEHKSHQSRRVVQDLLGEQPFGFDAPTTEV